MNKKSRIRKSLFITIMICGLLTGCTTLQKGVEKYSGGKERCILDAEDVTQFSYKERNYTILEETVSNSSLGEWIGYIRKFAAVDENGKIIAQEDAEKNVFRFLTGLADDNSEEVYVISFLNVYAAPDDTTYLIADVNGEYHKVIQSETVTNEDVLFDYRTLNQEAQNDFQINPNDATQLICNNIVYQVTSEAVSEDEVGKSIDILAEHITFDAYTKRCLNIQELNEIDWFGTNGQMRENRVYVDVCEISGTDKSQAVAVKVNSQYRLAVAQ